MPPPDVLADVLHAPVIKAANAINTSGLTQPGTAVDDWLDCIVLTLCAIRTVKGLEHQMRG